ncbi:MAG: single-stranded-DNA-specific exonuclease RecJ [Candidatus Dojkabacteria bacterium]|nr:MAG: single-stranded-DNA-specific exonuclease RecJ [Candidatus Dojkabacteria bacterium]
MKEYQLRSLPVSAAFDELVAILGSPALAAVYWAKGLQNKKQISEFTNSFDLLPADELHDLVSFGKLFLRHYQSAQKKIVVYGDYDADGAVAATILWRFLYRILGITDATVYIPDRREEGYGLNKEALLQLAQKGTSLVITVDCGVRDSDLIAEVTEKTGMEIVVTDHHQPSDNFPHCVSVHPLYPAHESKNRFTSGGVVAWKVVRYLEDLLHKSHEFSDSVVDLVGLSLITDIMPLVGENRSILKRALQKAKTNPSLGLRVLMEQAQIRQDEVSPYHFGYMIGPRLNASGRIGDHYLSTKLLSTDSPDAAKEYARQVSEINEQRQQMTQDLLERADAEKLIIENKVQIAAGFDWEEGIVGLVAGKLMNKHDLPTIVVSKNQEKQSAKGSARSFGELNITALFEQIASVFTRFGGHHSAAGFTLKDGSEQPLISALRSILHSNYESYVPKAVRTIDAYISPDILTETFFEGLGALEPFGPENAEPLFAVGGKVEQFGTIGKQNNHIKLELATEKGAITVLLFGRLDLLKELDQGKEVIVVGKPKREEFRGAMQITLIGETILPAEWDLVKA